MSIVCAGESRLFSTLCAHDDEASHLSNLSRVRQLSMFSDAVTPTQDLIIASCPRCQGLYFATRGSSHGWKFMPTIGRYVVKMLDGMLAHSLAKRWTWDRKKNEDGAHAHLLPTLEIRGLSEGLLSDVVMTTWVAVQLEYYSLRL